MTQTAQRVSIAKVLAGTRAGPGGFPPGHFVPVLLPPPVEASVRVTSDSRWGDAGVIQTTRPHGVVIWNILALGGAR